MLSVASFRLWNIEYLTRHEFFVKKFERALLDPVQCNRLRRFGRLHEFFWKLFLLSVRCPNHFFCPNSERNSRHNVGCLIDVLAFRGYRADFAPPWTLTITIRSRPRLKKMS